VRGGIGQLSEALAQAAQAYKAEIQTGVQVSQLLLTESLETGVQQAKGVVLANGEEILAKTVVSSLDPRRTFFGLVGAPNLEPGFVRRVKNIRYRGVTAKLNLALSELPRFTSLDFSVQAARDYLGGHIIICPNLEYLERAYDAAKYGTFSTQPYLDVVIPSVADPALAPAGQHVMSITMQYAPYELREGNWLERSQPLADTIINTLADHAPNLKDIIRHCQILTPQDWEQRYGLTEGCIFHGQMTLDQLLYMRPVPGYSQYRTPIDRLYLCGAGTHPGGGVTGAPGYNAAREILADFKRETA
jgi:phytoene dehydrogenase-like protein